MEFAWNLAGVMAGGAEVILTDAPIDAMAFWCAGFRNVTACYGTNGFTEDHLALFRRAGVERVLLAFDRDAAGERGAEELSARLRKEGFGTSIAANPIANSTIFDALRGLARQSIQNLAFTPRELL